MSSLEAPIEIVPYDPRWPARFQRKPISSVASWCHGLQDRSSTSAVLPYLAWAAKPVVDIIAAVQSLDASRGAIEAATAVGYWYSEYQVELEHWFCKTVACVSHSNLHLVPIGTPQWFRPIAFRDYLRANTDVAVEYEALKRQLAGTHRLDREAYTEAKRPFIDRLTDIAMNAGRSSDPHK